MEGKRLLRTIKLTNLLSYGPDGVEIELQPLNVLIGPNGSGKSNLIEAISLLKAAPRDISAPIRAGGGMPEWVWHGGEDSLPIGIMIRTIVFYPPSGETIDYTIRLFGVGQNWDVEEETIESEAQLDAQEPDRQCVYRYEGGRGWGQVKMIFAGSKPVKKLFNWDDLNPRESVLAQRKDPQSYPLITYLGNVFSEIALFRSFDSGRASALRGPQRADESASFLEESGKNLGMVLGELLNQPLVKKRLIAELKRFYEYVDDITTKTVANTIETFFHERGFSRSTPSSRLSDGTIRYLCLLSILCHPEPPPLVCIEDPEIGLHPDILPRVAELLVEASQRMQLIVTTHSDILVSALSHLPEAVVVCERDDDGSHMRRLEPERLKEWLEKYTLGELWRMGETGGNPGAGKSAFTWKVAAIAKRTKPAYAPVSASFSWNCENGRREKRFAGRSPPVGAGLPPSKPFKSLCDLTQRRSISFWWTQKGP
jgi:predicted ATPase